MKNQKLYNTVESKKSSKLGKESQRKPKKASKKLGAHHAFEEQEKKEGEAE